MDELYKLQKGVCRTVDHTRAGSHESLAHPRNVAILILFYRFYFGRFSAELLVCLLFRGWSTLYSVRFCGFPVTIPRFNKGTNANYLFLCIAGLWKFLSVEPKCYYFSSLRCC